MVVKYKTVVERIARAICLVTNRQNHNGWEKDKISSFVDENWQSYALIADAAIVYLCAGPLPSEVLRGAILELYEPSNQMLWEGHNQIDFHRPYENEKNPPWDEGGPAGETSMKQDTINVWHKMLSVKLSELDSEENNDN